MSKILYIAHFYKGATSYERLSDLKKDFQVDFLNINLYFPLWRKSISSIWRRLSFGPPFFYLYNALLRTLENNQYEFILIERNIYFSYEKLLFIKNKYKCKLIMFCHDSIQIKNNISKIFLNSLCLFDAVITTKDYDINLYKKYSAKKIHLVKDSISSDVLLNNINFNYSNLNYKYDLGFIGRWELGRENLIRKLSQDLDMKFVICGPGWLNKKSRFTNNVSIIGAVWGEDYINLIRTIKINLGLFSEKAKDSFTTRLIEVPTYSGFMLTNYNNSTNNIFSKNNCSEILYKNYDDLTKKINYFISNEQKRIELLKYLKECIILNGLTWEKQINSFIKDISN